MAILNLRQSPPSELPEGEPAASEGVESVREMLESGEPPGLDRIRRFVVKPRPRLWKLGVGIWLWIKRIAQWVLRLLRWIGRNLGRLARAARLAAFVGRRAQNFGARVGAVGRNWSSAEGRLGSAGGRLARFGARLVGGGASLAQVGEGVTELTDRAARFLADAPDSGSREANPGTQRSATRPPPRPRAKRGARQAAATPPDPPQAAKPRGAPSTHDQEASGAVVPASLPDDLPFQLKGEIWSLGRRPRRERVESVILALAEDRGWMEPAELAA